MSSSSYYEKWPYKLIALFLTFFMMLILKNLFVGLIKQPDEFADSLGQFKIDFSEISQKFEEL